MPRFGVLIAAVAMTAAVPLTLPAQAPIYRVRLSVVPIDVAMQASALTITGAFTGLKSAATVARVHRGPRTAMRGPAIGDLTATAATNGTISGTIELTKQQIDDLAAGRLYLQLHSEKAPEGNLWGWLLPETKK
jgi:hypothetical protein